MAALLADEPVYDSERVRIEAIDIAEDGASVPVAVHTDLARPVTVTSCVSGGAMTGV